MQRFPATFRFGVSTSAYQVEGDNVHSDLWRWERRAGWERSGRCADSFARWEEDIALAKALGVDSFRFSVEWGRVFPREGPPDAGALAHYRRVAERLLEQGIRPIVCFFHFTHPAWLFAQRPRLWGDAAIVDHFVRFAEAVARALPMVREWLPFNEANVHTITGNVAGLFPPGRLMAFRPLRTVLGGPLANMARAHRRVFAMLKELSGENRVGVAHNVAQVEPLRPGRDDAAARRFDEAMHWSFLDALALGRMDADGDGERELRLGEGSTLDWVGINYYTRVFVRQCGPLLPPLSALPLYSDVPANAPLLRPLFRLLTRGRAVLPEDDLLRETAPDGLREALLEAWRRYRLPLWITESGLADERGTERAPHLDGHLAAVRAAMDAGAPVEGFLYWSLLDNYEWGSFRPRFGLYRVHYRDGCRRELTEGGRRLREVIAGREGRMGA